MSDKSKLKIIIDNSGLKQKWIGIQAGIAETDFSKIVNGKMEATKAQKAAIAEVLGKTITEMFLYE